MTTVKIPAQYVTRAKELGYEAARLNKPRAPAANIEYMALLKEMLENVSFGASSFGASIPLADAFEAGYYQRCGEEANAALLQDYIELHGLDTAGAAA